MLIRSAATSKTVSVYKMCTNIKRLFEGDYYYRHCCCSLGPMQRLKGR